MNKNKDNYKDTFLAFTPTDTAVEKVFELTTDKKKKASNLTFRRIAAAAFAFVLIVGGGFGVNSAVSKRNAVSDKLGVMIAMAGEKELLAAGQKNEQDVFYGIYIADLNDKQACEDAKNRWNNDKNKQRDLAEGLGSNHITAGVKSGSTQAYNKHSETHTAVMYTLSAGNFVLSLSDYTNVKDITIENTSEYGNICVEFWNRHYDLSEMDMSIYSEVFDEVSGGFYDVKEYSFGRDEEKIVLTKDDLMFGIENGVGWYDTANGEVNKGYTVDWEPSGYLNFAIGENVNFDLSQIKDIIIFTVHYEDGTSEQASVSLEFDSDGYMHIADAD